MAEVIVDGVSSPLLSPEEERFPRGDIAMAGEAQTTGGSTFITQRWWRTWSAYVNQHPAASTNEGSSLEHQGSGYSNTLRRPSSIDNSDLIRGSSSENSSIEIHRILVEGADYILLPEGVWNQLYAWYGGGPALARKAITRGSSQTDLTVEVYPLQLRLHLRPRPDQCDIIISRKETIGALHKKACEIFRLDSDQVYLWDYYGLQKWALLIDLHKTLDDANIQMDQDILVEVLDHFSSYATIVLESGSVENSSSATVEHSMINHSTAGGTSTHNGVARSFSLDLPQFQNLSLTTRERNKTRASLGVGTRGSCIGLIGLLNFGNTCFMNSAIQCLVHTPEFANYFIGDFQQEINSQNPLGMGGELAMEFAELLRRLWGPGRVAFAPLTFKAKLAHFAPQFGGLNQHDSQELLTYLLDGLHEDLNRVKEKPYIESREADGRPDEEVADEYWANHIARNDSIIVDVCQGQYKSTLSCPVCDKISVTFDPFMHLSLPLQSTTPRKMTVTIFSCDGSTFPTYCTVMVPKQGRCRELIQALSNACSLKQNENILLSEVDVEHHMIRKFFEDPLLPLSVIKDDVRLSAYKIPKLIKDLRYFQLVHRREETETSDAQTTTMWKPFGTPLIFAISRGAIITRGDIQLMTTIMLSPLLKPETSNANTPLVEDPPSANNGSEACSPVKENSHPLLKLPLKLVDGNNTHIDLSVEEQKTIIPSSSVLLLVYIDWSPELLMKYEMQYLENLPEVFKNGCGTKKAHPETLSLYSCLEAFLREEPLVPEDMWLCPQCKEHRQASKKLDLWRLPKVLVIHLKRFSYNRTMRSKVHTFVNFPFHAFDLTKYVANKKNSDPQVYELYAVVNHYGTMGRGHYTAHVKLSDDDKWYNFNDNRVLAIRKDDVLSNAAYMLFYRRVKTDGPSVSINGEPSSSGQSFPVNG